MAMASWRRARKKGARSFHGDGGAPAPLPSKRKQDPSVHPRSRKRARRALDRPPDSTVFVGDLHLATTSERLKAFFENYGDVAKARVVPEQGYGFVTFEAREIAEGVVVAAAGKEGILMGNTKIRVSWASGPLPQGNTSVQRLPVASSDLKKRRPRQAPPRRYRSRLFLSAVASAVASATAESVIQGNGPGPLPVQHVPLPNREVIAYDDWL